MERIVVFVNDAEHALQLLQPLLDGASGPTHWIVVAAAPRLTRHIGRWVSHSARQQQLERWSTELFAAIELALRRQAGSQVQTLLVKRPLVEVSEQLKQRHGSVRWLDARKPGLGRADEPISAERPSADRGPWMGMIAATAGLGAMLALTD
jgi:hypothetical protein